MNWHKAMQNVGKTVKIRPAVRKSAMRDGDWKIMNKVFHAHA